MHACAKGQRGCLGLLLEANSNLHAFDEHGCTAVHSRPSPPFPPSASSPHSHQSLLKPMLLNHPRAASSTPPPHTPRSSPPC